MAGDAPLEEYRAKRDFEVTSEPAPAPARVPEADDNRFVIQEHHATALHWDLRLERDGVLASWAVPKGLPPDPRVNHLAVHTEDHPLEYLDFEGHIPEGEYGGGSMSVWDRGTYECEEWEDRKVKVVLHGRRVRGRYALVATGGRKGRDWLVHRMDPAEDPSRQLLPRDLEPMTAELGASPPGGGWLVEPWWPGRRLVVPVEGGRAELGDARVLAEVRDLAEALGSLAVVLDVVVVALGDDGRPDPERLDRRLQAASPTAARRLAAAVPLTVVVLDLLWLDGHDVTGLGLEERRRLLGEALPVGRAWTLTPRHEVDVDAYLDVAAALGFRGVVAKRRASIYTPGRPSADWVAVAVVDRSA